jgi:enoyl-CoA hydratase/carnithine racemase
VIPADELESALAGIVKPIVAAPPLALRLAKRSIDRGVELDPNGALATELAAIEENLASGVWRAGIGGFGKRP